MRIGSLLLITLLFVPGLSWAAGVFEVAPTDKSMEYLGMVFGTVGPLPITSSGNPIFSQLIYIFNTIVFALGIIIIIITSVIGTVNTAQEGETLGKKWSSIWIPARAGIGMYLLLPSVGGFNWIQIVVMWLIVQGVGAANALWKQVIVSNETQGSLVSDTRKTDLTNGINTVAAIFNSIVCMNKVNQKMIDNPTVADSVDEFVSMTTSTDGRSVYFGRSKDAAGKPLCGGVTVPDVGANPVTGQSAASDPVVIERRQILVDAIYAAKSAIEPSANEATTVPSSNWVLSSSWVSASRALKGAIQSLNVTFNTLTRQNQKAIVDGWIHAGTYYFTLVQSGAVRNEVVNFTPIGISDQFNNILGMDYGPALVTEISNTQTTYLNYVNNDPTLDVFTPSESSGGSLQAISITQPSVGGRIGSLMDMMFGESFFGNAASDFGKMITTGCLSNSSDPAAQTGDPLICMASFGGTIASTTEAVFWVALITAFGIWVGAAIMSCVQPVAHAFNFLLAIFIPVATMMIMVIWGAGISLALYAPLIPFLVFTFASLTWIILVIEAMVGAPLIGLTLVVPSEDEIGKAGHAIVILFGLFLRPALMILGFIFAQKLLMVGIGMLNFGFAGTIQMSLTNGVGLFGFITLLVLYAGIAISLVHEAFSLIYILPDKTLRWMGIAGEGSEAGAQTREIEGSMDKGAGVGKGLMKGSLGFMGGKAQGQLKKSM